MSVFVNQIEITIEEQERIFQVYGLRLPDGNYWYDRISGAWGNDGAPTLGYTRAGLNLGGPLAPDATVKGNGWVTALSKSRTFINGRELAATEALELAQILLQGGVALVPGRYWLDALGYFGQENAPPF